MKLSITRLIGVLFLSAMYNSAAAQFKPTKEFGALMNKVGVSISIADQKYFAENFSTTTEKSTDEIGYNYQLSAQHNTLPLHFTIGFKADETIDVDHNLMAISTIIGMKPGHDVQHFKSDMIDFFGANQIGFIHAKLRLGELKMDNYFKYGMGYILGMSSAKGYYELIIYYDKREELEEEISGTINSILTAFKFKETVDDNKNYAGIGVSIGSNRKYYHYQVKGVVKGSTSEIEGVLPGDFIIQVNDKYVDDLDMSRLVNLIRGEINSEVKIVVQRGTLFFSYVLTRKALDLSGDVELIKPTDLNLGKIYFLNTTAVLINNELVDDDFEDFIENVADGKKYKYYLDFPMSTPGTITKTSKNSRIEYIMYSTKDEVKVKAFYDKLKGYLQGEYGNNANYEIVDDGGLFSLKRIDPNNYFLSTETDEKVLAELSFTSTSTGFYTVKYVFYK